MQKAIEQAGGIEVVGENPDIQARILAGASELPEINPETRTQMALELAAKVDDRSDSLDSTIGAELERFKETAREGQRKLLVPIRELVKIGYVDPTVGYGRLVESVIDFGTYAKASKMSVTLPRELNQLQLPMSYAAGLTLADTIKTEASKRTSIWS
jgi:hypothetical protein